MGTVARLLAENISFRCTSVDRIGIRGYIPGLQYEGGVVKFLLERGYRIPSPAGLNHNHDRLVSQLDALVAARDVPVVRFRRDECKEDIARPYQQAAAAAGRAGLVLVGKAQERTSSWRGFVEESHTAHRPGHPHFAWRRMSSVPDHWYLYFFDAEWGPAFLKICGYAPYPLWACANGHEWAKRQLAKAGVEFDRSSCTAQARLAQNAVVGPDGPRRQARFAMARRWPSRRKAFAIVAAGHFGDIRLIRVDTYMWQKRRLTAELGHRSPQTITSAIRRKWPRAITRLVGVVGPAFAPGRIVAGVPSPPSALCSGSSLASSKSFRTTRVSHLDLPY